MAQEILQAAERELAEQGLAAVSMSSIAKRAGVAVGTLYNYFKDKEVLLSSLLDDRRARFKALLDEAITARDDLPFEAQLEQVVDTLFGVFESHRDYLRIVLSNEKPTIMAGVKSPHRQFIDRLRPLVAKGVDGGVLAPADADLYAAALASLVRGVMIELIDDTTRPFRAATPFVVRLFLDGARRQA